MIGKQLGKLDLKTAVLIPQRTGIKAGEGIEAAPLVAVNPSLEGGFGKVLLVIVDPSATRAVGSIAS